ncbi:ArsR/SmtB family transcription factor [Thermococcus celer]|uniref:Transcriptional regulator n=1 Tax=Thermococcus celer Vu 13 = JCM 8558 TaxID=1293037 RepID=A0A218P0P0_THECE|nr:metalloregulator ArsR/SmtB family transcription factor [Thermococcus celer]ASI98500.1 transcriptional regulator [Thermococcus celer Vu 13 = JCM 8558]
MKIGEFLDELKPKQREAILRCARESGIIDLEEEVELNVEDNVINFLKAISNPLRLKILKLLKDNWLCVCLISKILDRDQTLISHHLRTLKSLGLISERREGKMRFYRTNTEVLEGYLSRVREELV